MTDEVLRVLKAIEAHLAAIRASLEATPVRRRPVLDEAHAALARAVAEATPGRAFTAKELCDHARLDGQEALRAAIEGAVGDLAPQRLGHALRRLEGHGVEKIGEDGGSAIWVSRGVESPQIPVRRLSIA